MDLILLRVLASSPHGRHDSASAEMPSGHPPVASLSSENAEHPGGLNPQMCVLWKVNSKTVTELD